jgi:hypothetical protein
MVSGPVDKVLVALCAQAKCVVVGPREGAFGPVGDGILFNLSLTKIDMSLNYYKVLNIIRIMIIST